METDQTREEQASKSMDMTPSAGGAESAAESHGTLRHVAGFDLVQLVAEFRALRASVLSLWELSPESSAPGAAIREITRFNEGLDQALAESVDSFSADLAASRDMFIGVLGHDLRGPLSAVMMSNRLLERSDLTEAARTKAAKRSGRAVKEMSRLITDLLDYTRTRLGAGIPIECTDCDVGVLCSEALDAIEASHPDLRFEFSKAGDLRAAADGPKLCQALANLLGNAVQHGDRRDPITISVAGHDDSIAIEVANTGTPIPPDALLSIFRPMTRAPAAEALGHHADTSVGLGLFIAREIVNGHQGSIVATSTAARTAFTIRLPRNQVPGR